MISKKLAGTEIVTSAIGFGCSALLGDKPRAEALRLLQAAFDSGIRYFDVARMYGYGEAESVVGEFSRHKRQEIVIATKFGIEPSAPALARGPVRAAVRRVMKLSPNIRRFISRRAVSALKTGRFQPQSAARSLETSLRALQTDYIDVFLLHDCSVQDTLNDELKGFLEETRRAGKIRHYGVGTSLAEVLQICRQAPAFASVVQFGHSVLAEFPRELHAAPRAIVTHGALAGSYAALRRHLEQRPEVARSWSGQIGVDCADPAVLAALMLGSAVQSNPSGPVLFSSRRPETIRANVATVSENRFTPEQLAGFHRLALSSGVQPV